MDDRLLGGVVPMLPTPFDQSGALALEEIPRLVAFALRQGSTGIAALGLGGEAALLSEAERSQVAAAVLESLAGGAPAIIGCAAQDTATACRLARHAAALGAAMVMVAPPNRQGISRAELIDHFLAVARAAEPAALIVQDAPSFLEAELGPELVLELALKSPNVRAVKTEAVPAGSKVGTVVDAVGDRLAVFGGHGGLHLLDELEAGARGTIPGTEAVDACVAIVRAYGAGEREQAAARYCQVAPLLAYMFQSLPFFLACTKQVLCWRGVLRTAATRAPGARLDKRALHGLEFYFRLAALPGEPMR